MNDKIKFDIIPNQSEVKTKLEVEDGSLKMEGEFINFSITKTLENDQKETRTYKNSRIEIKIPCEHAENRQECDMELQFYSEENIDYTAQLPTNKMANLAFSIIFAKPQQSKQNYFFDGFLTEDKKPLHKAEAHHLKSEITVNIMEALKHIDLTLDSSEGQKQSTIHYGGSFTKPQCDENLYWFILRKNDHPIEMDFVDRLKELFLSEETQFKDKTNNREFVQQRSHEFYDIELTRESMEGMRTFAPLFVKKQLMPDLTEVDSDETIEVPKQDTEVEQRRLRFKSKKTKKTRK